MTNRQGLAALVLLETTQLVGCTTTGQSSYQSFGDRPYFIGMESVDIDSEYAHRYVCASSTPLMCECPASRLPHICRCVCASR